MLYRDFVLLLLCYILWSYVIVVLRVHGCACAGVRTRNKRGLECSCSMLALFHNFVLGFLSYNTVPSTISAAIRKDQKLVPSRHQGDILSIFLRWVRSREQNTWTESCQLIKFSRYALPLPSDRLQHVRFICQTPWRGKKFKVTFTIVEDGGSPRQSEVQSLSGY